MRPSIVWLITDTHFYHDAIIEACGRPPDHVELIMKNLRYYLAKQDLLIHLGDVIFYQYPKLKAMLESVPGRKILTMGNHDRKSRNWYMNNGFDLAVDMFTLDNVIFSHKPLEHFPTDITINIHGHWHNQAYEKREEKSWHDPTRHRLLAIEDTEYKPVKLIDFLRQRARTD